MSDDLKFIITIIAGLFTGGVIQFFASRRKNTSDAYSILLDALTKSGQTIEDLFGMLAEVPQMKSQLRVAQDEIVALKKQSSFWLSFARAFHTGAQINADYIRKLEHVPPYEPPKFPTGPLSTGSTAS